MNMTVVHIFKATPAGQRYSPEVLEQSYRDGGVSEQ